MTTNLKPPERHLVTDEVIELVDKFGTDMKFRVRIWRGSDATPVVLASPTPSDDGETYSPYCMTTKIANFVLGAMLGHPCHLMLYYEVQVFSEGNQVLEQIHFEYYGHAHRLKMYKPSRETIEWGRLEHFLQGAVER
jgi:hypothetical protein